jgi:hypothetical protein
MLVYGDQRLISPRCTPKQLTVFQARPPGLGNRLDFVAD